VLEGSRRGTAGPGATRGLTDSLSFHSGSQRPGMGFNDAGMGCYGGGLLLGWSPRSLDRVVTQ
jgi:hypothetical protein